MKGGYRIGRTTMTNFLAFERAEFDFSQPGLTVVEGSIDVEGCDSNGSGKSALLEAPLWAITGRTIRERCRGDDVVRIGSEGGCSVHTEIHGERKIEITRYRKHPTFGNKVVLMIDGKDVSRGTSSQTDVAICQELGIDFETILNTIAFGARAEVRSFFFATDAERKRLMDKLLGLEVFEKAQTIARAKMRAVVLSLDPLMDRQMAIGFAVEEKRESIAAIKNTQRVDPVELRNQRIALKRHTKRVRIAERQLKRATDERDQAANEYAELLQRHETAMFAHERAKQKAWRLVTRLSDTAHVLEDTSSELKKRAARMLKLSGGECPTCVQPISKKVATKVVRTMHEEAGRLDEQIAAKRARADRLSKKAEKLKPPKPPSRGEVDAHEADCDMRRRALTKASAAREVVESRLRLLEDAAKQTRDRIESISEEINTLLEEESDNLDRQREIRAEISRLEFWATAFGHQGLKSFVIESELPRINALATTYARRLLGEGTTIELTATRQLKTQDVEREEMTVTASIPGCANSYAGASKGQRHRLDLAMILAFRSVVAARSACPFDQLFADEMFDGIDETGVDCVAEILHEVSAHCPVVLVTHDVRLKSVGDRRVLVKHNGERAELQ